MRAREGEVMRKKKTNKLLKYLPVLIILLSVTIMVGSTFAFFNDKTDKSSNLNFDKIELSEETSVGIKGEILDLIPGSTIVDYPISFSKAIDSKPIYVRAKLSFSLPEKYRDDLRMQEVLNEIRQSSDVNILSDEQNGAVWSSKQGSYFYLLDSSDLTKLKRVDTTYTYTLSDAISLPRDFEQFEDKYQYMNTINFHIAFEAIQADNVSNVLKETKITFSEVFPGVESFGAAVTVTLKDFDLDGTLEIIELNEGDILYQPNVEIPLDENNNTIMSVEGWYEDETLQHRYLFGNKIYEDLTLYPKAIEIARGLEFIPIYNSADKIIAYKVARGTCTETELLIPSWYNHKPVTTIAEDGFRDSAITSITMFDNITEIEANAFNGCMNLTSITLPNNLVKVGEDAFIGSDNLSATYSSSLERWLRIEFANGEANPINYSKNLYIDSTTGTYSLRSGATLLTHLEPPDSISKINAYAFYNCQSLRSLTLKSNIKEIGEYAFYNCFNIEDVNIEGDVEMKEGALDGCDKIENLPIPPSPSIGGYNGTGITDAIIPEGVTELKPGAFKDCENLHTVELPKSLNKIQPEAFKNCVNLKELVIPSGVTYIGKNAFTGSGLNKIIFKPNGSTPIEIEDDAFDEDIEDVEIESPKDESGLTALEVWLLMEFGNEYSNPVYYAKSLELDGKILTDLVVPNSITKINAYAFINLETLISVTIPSHLESIGEKAFLGCVNNKNVTNNSSLDIVAGAVTHGFVAYYMVDSGLMFTGIRESNQITGYSVSQGLCNLSVIAIPSSYNGYPVTNISANGFKNNTNLTEIILPDTITTIENYAFQYCTSLTSITIPKKVKTIGTGAFSDCTQLTTIDLPQYLTSISNNIFYNCKKLTEINIPSKVTSIGAYAFQNCSLLEEVAIPEEVTYIGNSVFEGCEKLTTVNIPEKTKTLSNRAFYNCKGLKNLYFDAVRLTTPSSSNSIFYGSGSFTLYIGEKVEVIPSNLFGAILSDVAIKVKEIVFAENGSLTTIENNAFKNAIYLSEAILPDTVTTLGEGAFESCSNLTKVVLSENLQKIQNSTFKFCSKLTEVDMGSSVTAIGEYAFNGCSILENVEIGENVKSIGQYAFYACSGLTEINIPNKVTSIGAYAFKNCTGVTSIVIGESVTSIGGEAFYACHNVSSVEYNAKKLTSLTSSNKIFYELGKNISLNGVDFVIGENVEVVGQYLFHNGSTSITARIYLANITFAEDAKCTSIGDYAFYNTSLLNNLVMPNTIKSVGNYAFRYVKEVTFSTALESIGSYAFQGCGLTKIELFEGLKTIGTGAFDGCEAVTTLSIPDSVTSIGAYAFEDLENLTAITIPKNIKSIGGNAFSGCDKVTTLNYNIEDATASISGVAFSGIGSQYSYKLVIGEGVVKIPSSIFQYANINEVEFKGNKLETIDTYAFYSSKFQALTIPEGVETIGNYAFSECTKLETVSLPSTLTSVGDYAFQKTKITSITINSNITFGVNVFDGCSAIQSVSILGGLTKIADSMFAGCTSLTTVALGDSVTSIGAQAFSGCTKLANLTLTNNIETISSSAFYNCQKLTKVTLPTSLKELGNSAFYNCSELTEVVMPDGVETMGTYIFESCSKLNKVNIPNGITEIPVGTFQLCSALQSVTIGSNITKISNYAFSNTGLNSINIPNSVTEIGSYAFRNCQSLTSFEFPSSVELVGNEVLQNCGSLTSIKVNSVFGYTNANNNEFISSVYLFNGAGVNGDGITLTFGEDVTEVQANLCYFSSSSKTKAKITSIVFEGDKVTKIGGYAFYYCIYLTNITIPSSVNEIGNCAFAYTSAVTNIYYNAEELTETELVSSDKAAFIGSGAENVSITIGKNVKTVPDLFRYMNDTITSLTFEEGSVCETISNQAFNGRSSKLTTLVLPNTIETIGTSAFYNCTSLTEINLPTSLTSLYQHAFYNCNLITTITIPENLTYIGQYVFNGASALTSIIYKATNVQSALIFENAGVDGEGIHATIGANVEFLPGGLFNGNPNIIDVTFEEGSVCKGIGDHAFYNLSTLTSIDLPDTITSIGRYAFYKCAKLELSKLPSSLVSIDEYAFSEFYKLPITSLPNTVETIGYRAFKNCGYLALARLSENLTTIGAEAFYNCSNIVVDTLPEGLTSISASAFEGCRNMTFASLPDGLTIIGEKAFYGCDNITVSSLPSSLTSLGNKAFYSCDKITISSLPASLVEIGEYVFAYCGSITSFTISRTRTKIETGMFAGNSQLTTISLPNTITEIGDYAFQNCSKLEITSLPDSIITIGYYAFQACVKLALTALPSSLVTLNSYSFYGCKGLTEFSVGTALRTIGRSVFYTCDNITAVHYEGAQEEYDLITIDLGNDPFTTHVIISWVEVSRVAATCTSEGLVIYTRGEGDAVETKEVILPMLPHDIVDHQCSVCGHKILTTLDLSPTGINCFYESADGTYYYSETKWSNQAYNARITANFDCEITITWSVWEYSASNNDKFYIKLNDVAISGVNGIASDQDGVNTIKLKAGDVVYIQYVMDGVYDSGHGAKFSYTQQETV